MALHINPRPEPIVLDFDDRRRMAEQQLLIAADRNAGVVYPMEFGQIILAHVLNLDEVPAMNKAVNTALAKRFSRGMM